MSPTRWLASNPITRWLQPDHSYPLRRRPSAFRFAVLEDRIVPVTPPIDYLVGANALGAVVRLEGKDGVKQTRVADQLDGQGHAVAHFESPPDPQGALATGWWASQVVLPPGFEFFPVFLGKPHKDPVITQGGNGEFNISNAEAFVQKSFTPIKGCTNCADGTAGGVDADGTVAFVEDDLGVDAAPAGAEDPDQGDGSTADDGGFAGSWGGDFGRSWGNGYGYDYYSPLGTGWVDHSRPILAAPNAGQGNAIYRVSMNARSAPMFHTQWNASQPYYSVLDERNELTSGGGEFQFTTDQGDRYTFFGFDAATDPWLRGRVKQVADHTGFVTTVGGYTPQGNVTLFRRTHGSEVEEWRYTYGDGMQAQCPNAPERLMNTQLVRSTDGGVTFATVRTADYTYYTMGELDLLPEQRDGNPGDLRSAEVREGGVADAVVRTSYYRYHAADWQNNSLRHLLYVAVSGDSFDRLTAATGTKLSTLDDLPVNQLFPYADRVLRYDDYTRVTLADVQGAGCSVCTGGVGRHTYTYALNPLHAPPFYGNDDVDPNVWIRKTTEYLPDGSTTVLYVNARSQPILKVFTDGVTGQVSRTFTKYRYDPANLPSGYHRDGEVLWTADAAAVTGHNEQYDDLVHLLPDGTYEFLADSAGQITTYEYGTTTTATEVAAGDVFGRVKAVRLRHGDADPTPGLLLSRKYFAHTANGITTYPVAAETAYPAENTTDPADPTGRTTTYSYQWFPGVNAQQPQVVTVTAPPVAAGENGPGTASSGVTVYDVLGRPVWTKDADGFLRYSRFDTFTGVAVRAIEDVDTTQSADFTDLPSGWATPAGGGLHLTTLTQVNGLGQPLWVRHPNGAVDYLTYDWPGATARTYAGWSALATAGPVRQVRQDRVGGDLTVDGKTARYTYREELTYAPASVAQSPPVIPYDAGPRPAGTEPVSNVQTLTREYLNPAGQVVWTDAYFDLTGLSYYDGNGKPAFALGTEGVNFLRTYTRYDKRGRPSRTVTPAGTITRTEFDGRGRPLGTWVGTDDTSTGAPPAFSVRTDTTTLGWWRGKYGADGYSIPTVATALPAFASVQFTNAQTWTWTGPTTDPRGLETPDGSTHKATCWWGTVFTLDVTFTDGQSHLVRLHMIDWDNRGRAQRVEAIDPTTQAVLDTRDVTAFSTGLWLDYRVAGSIRFRFTDLTGSAARDAVLGGLFLDPAPATNPWSGATPAGMTQVQAVEYDDGLSGNGNPTRVTEYPGGGAPARVTRTWYDWRNRPLAVKDGVEGAEAADVNRPLTASTYNNLGQLLSAARYDGDGVTPALSGDGLAALPAAQLRAYSTYSYDTLGRAYRAETLGVDPATGALTGRSLRTDRWFDRRGNTVKEAVAGAAVVKRAFDGAGRVTRMSATDGGGDAGWADALTVTGDAVLSQTDTTYDPTGNVLLVTDRRRFHDATLTGSLGDPASTTQAKARVSYTAYYYDPADRPTAAVDVGTNGGTAWTRPTTVPARSDTVLVSGTAYNAAGWVDAVTDPRGLVARTFYDALGRVVKAVENYVDGTPSAQDDKTVLYGFDSVGRRRTLTLLLAGGGQQVTESVYGVTRAGGSGLDSNNLVRETWHPDATTGASSSAVREQYKYNALGQVVQLTDRNQNVHDYTFDPLGRPVSDAVTLLGANVDGAVRRRETAYDGQGNAYRLTNYDAATGGAGVNQVQREYNAFGQLAREYQATAGAVSTGTSPQVQYAYTGNGAGTALYSRPTTVTYPDGAVLASVYSAGLDDAVSRPSSLTLTVGGTTTTAEGYTYLGLGTVVERTHPQPDVTLTYISQGAEAVGDAGDPYTGLDRFGRVVDQRWRNGTTEVDRFRYGYDRDGNRVWEENAGTQSGSADRSEFYTYDGLNQLTAFARGTLNAGKTGISGTASRTQAFDPDAAGNFATVTNDGTAQARTYDRRNQLTVAGAAALTYDPAGNLTTDETGRTLTWDAWGRLVQVRDSGGTVVANFRYDAADRRVRDTRGGVTTDLLYSGGQVVEERAGAAATARFVWSPVYADAMVLRDQDADGNTGNGLEQRLYPLTDANHDVRSLVSTAGAAVERYLTDPYGAITVLTAAYGARATSSYAWAHGHQGLRLVSEAGLYDNRARWLSPTLQRFASNDPLGFAAGDANLYRYVGGNPVNNADPTGLILQNIIIGAALGAAFGGAFQAGANLFNGRPVGEGVGQAMLSGAIGGALAGATFGAFTPAGVGATRAMFFSGIFAGLTGNTIDQLIRKGKVDASELALAGGLGGPFGVCSGKAVQCIARRAGSGFERMPDRMLDDAAGGLPGGVRPPAGRPPAAAVPPAASSSATDYSKFKRLNIASGGEFDGPDVLHLNMFVDDIGTVSGGKVGADYTKMPEIPSNHFPEVVGRNVQFGMSSEITPTAQEIFRVTQPGGSIRVSFSSQYDAVEAALTAAGFVNVQRGARTPPHGVTFTANKPK